MPDNTNAIAVSFSNQKARPTADSLGAAYQTMKRFQQEWVAENITTNIPNDANYIADNSSPNQSPQDGRKPVTDAMVNNLKALVDALVTYLETNVTINAVTNTRIVWLQQMTVNEQAKF